MNRTMESTITQIRAILRNEGITGMDSITHCIAFIVFRMLDENLCDHVGIDKSLAFQNLIKQS